jgi:hypothetical protein
MKLFRDLAAFAAVASTALIFATPAAAQATRTWVSGVGDDANPCSRTAPCKTFAGAIAKTAAAGEIDCLDPGGFGGLNITKAITIDCTAPGGIGGVLVSGTSGFTVNVPTGVFVQLIGLDINGIAPNTGPGTIGVNVLGGTVLISNSLIYQFQGTTSCGSLTGIAGTGVCVSGAVGTKLTIENSLIRNNGYGVINSPTSGANTVVIEHSLLDANVTANVTTGAAGAKVYLNNDSLTNCPTAFSNTTGTVLTYGNNVMTGTIGTLTSQALQ